MIDQTQLGIQGMMQAIALKASLFPPNSRYSGIETTTMETATGKTVIYLRRRFVPHPEKFALLQEHTVTEGDRLDNITAQYLGDPEQFWRICDANRAMHPDKLTATIGRKLKITLPEGIPGILNA
ncbi:LysM domain-containing protein [Nostoc muscorum FACHB-395]|nr:LysM domain-containing protein [Desmonostoc muscorum FACHB-395]